MKESFEPRRNQVVLCRMIFDAKLEVFSSRVERGENLRNLLVMINETNSFPANLFRLVVWKLNLLKLHKSWQGQFD